MNILDIPEEPFLFSDDNKEKKIAEINLGVTTFIFPRLIPNHFGIIINGFSIIIRIQQADSFSFLNEFGLRMDGIVFKNLKKLDDTLLEFKLIADGTQPLLKFVTFDFETNGINLNKNFREFTYKVK